jgi:hypothetical protein
MTALIKATTSFVTEKLIVQRERKSGIYAYVYTYMYSYLYGIYVNMYTWTYICSCMYIHTQIYIGSYTVAPYFISKLFAEVPLSAFFPCLAGFVMYKLCGLNPASGRLASFLLILTVESFAATALGMCSGINGN